MILDSILNPFKIVINGIKYIFDKTDDINKLKIDDIIQYTLYYNSTALRVKSKILQIEGNIVQILILDLSIKNNPMSLHIGQVFKHHVDFFKGVKTEKQKLRDKLNYLVK